MQSAAPIALVVTSATLKAGATMPVAHTPDGRNDSPALSWTGVPASAREIVVFCEDPDAGNPPPFVHWVVYKIPASAPGLPPALPLDSSGAWPSELRGAVQGLNGFRRPTYRGPAPPPGRPHTYRFVVSAIDLVLAAPAQRQPPLARAELLELMRGHVVAQGDLVVTYGRAAAAP